MDTGAQLVPPQFLPLIRHAGPDEIVAYRGGREITVRRFLSDVGALADSLPEREHVLNNCGDRYRFSVGLAASILRRQMSVLPPSQDREMVRQIAIRFPGVYCLTDAAQPEIDLPQTLYHDGGKSTGANAAPPEMPLVEASRIVACVFTSGSTGEPRIHFKHWGALVKNVLAEGERLDLEARTEMFAGAASGNERSGVRSSGRAPISAPVIVGTVPSQHMFGLESTLLLAWQHGAALVAERPFFPADIFDVLTRIRPPRVLVTTPFHLRTLLAEHDDLPPLKLILSATAPLSRQLALDAEERYHAPLVEIFGMTETGQLAARRTARSSQWNTFKDVELENRDGVVWASGGHIEQPEPLSDVIELHSERSFSLLGRSTDMVNIAGKRTSLAYLNLQLNAIPGVSDGAFLMPGGDEAMRDGVTRLTALVVAPTLTANRLLDALRERIDPVFLPRPLHFVDALPRNATGKLTQSALSELIKRIGSAGASPAAAATDASRARA